MPSGEMKVQWGVLRSHDKAHFIFYTQEFDSGCQRATGQPCRLPQLTRPQAIRVCCSAMKRHSPWRFCLLNPRQCQSQCECLSGIPSKDTDTNLRSSAGKPIPSIKTDVMNGVKSPVTTVYNRVAQYAIEGELCLVVAACWMHDSVGGSLELSEQGVDQGKLDVGH